MADRTVRVRLVGDTGSYQANMDKAAGSTRKLGTAIGEVGSKSGVGRNALGQFTKGAQQSSSGITSVGASFQTAAGHAGAFAGVSKIAVGSMAGFIGAQAIIGTLGRAFSSVGREVLAFDTNMRNVQSITHQSDETIKRLGQQVLSLSDRLPQSASDLADGLYEVASSGFSGAAGVEVLTRSAEAAAAGLTTTGVAAKGITAVLNAYGLSASSAGDVSDILFQTVNVGVVRFDELSAVLGDFVGTANALGVPIDDASAALATMTLSGIGVAESGTALNRVMTSLIAPSEGMAVTLRGLGFESGVAAIQALGLQGTMVALGHATGGSVEALRQLFPETRALKGAFALLSAEGKTYQTSMSGVADESVRAKATAKALAEQAKSLSFQLQVAGNDITNLFVGVGQTVAPALASGILELRGMGDTVSQVADMLVREFGPGVEDIIAALGDFGTMAADAWDALSPFVEAGLGASMVVLAGAFRAAAAAGHALTGFLVDNQIIVEVLAAVIVGKLVVALGIAAAETLYLKALYAVDFFAAAIKGATAFAVAMYAGATAAEANAVATEAAAVANKGAALSFGGLAAVFNPVTIALTAAAAAYVVLTSVADNENEKAKARVDHALVGIKLDSFANMDKARGIVDRLGASADKAAESYQGWGGAIRTIGENALPFVDNAGERSLKEQEQADSRRGKLIERQRRTAQNALDVLARTGTIPRGRPRNSLYDLIDVQEDPKLRKQADRVIEWGRSLGVDVTGGGKKAQIAVDAVAASMLKAGRSGVVSGKQIKDGLIDPEELIARGEEFAKYAESVVQGFSKTTDLISGIGTGKDADASANGIRTFYAGALKATEDFVTDSQAAMTNGYPPELLARLIAAGPEAAGPIMKTLAETTDKNFVKMIEDAERRLAEFRQKEVELGRLTKIAQEGGAGQAADLPLAIRIGAEKAAQGGAGTVQSIAAKLNLSVFEARRVIDEFVLGVPEAKMVLSVETATADQDLVALAKKIDAIDPTITTMPKLGASAKEVADWWDRLKTKLVAAGVPAETLAKVGPEDAQVWFTLLNQKLDWARRPVGTIVTVTTNGINELDYAIGRIETIRSKDGTTANVYVQEHDNSRTGKRGKNVDGTSDFDGNPWTPAARGLIVEPGSVQSFALGGYSKPKIWRPGEGIQFNEPDARGEALIPLANDSRRSRATAILGDVAGRFGYGLTNGSSGPTTIIRTVKVDAPLIIPGTFYGDAHLKTTIMASLDAHSGAMEHAIEQAG